MHDVSRRDFLGTLPALTLIPAAASQGTPSGDAGGIAGAFPQQDPAIVRDIVAASHGNVARVKELISARPALARASWDWGYGDWETALGAASHVGNKEIAAILLAAGAHPTIFSAAMLGQLDTVKAFVTSTPGIQRTRGPHGITLLDHARAGESSDVIKYLETLGDAHLPYPNEPLPDGDTDALLGSYRFGQGPSDRLIVSRNNRGALVIRREGEPDRNLFHHGGRVFNPSGAEAVRISFQPATGRARTVVVADGAVTVTASV